jgi:L-seryl-tRNA(Ser) seleniumtransferase
MNSDKARQIYENLGVRPIINAGGSKTILGGSRISPAVQAAAEAANRYYVEMEDLLKGSGQILAGILGAEAALVTPGCFSAIALGTAAIMTGSDPQKIDQLPDTSGMKHEFIIQKCQRYKYDRALSTFGGKLVEAGDESGTSVEQLEAAITPQTAGLYYLAIGHRNGQLPIEAVLTVARGHNLPLLVDAASAVYPLSELTRYNELGADLVCYGAKYFGAYNGTGILAGRKNLVDAAYLHSFIGFELNPSRGIGRGLKLDRQEIVAVVVALQEWIELDHEERLAEHERKGQVIREAVAGMPQVSTHWDPDGRGLGSGVEVQVDEAALGKTAAGVVQTLKAGTPSIWAMSHENVIRINVPQLFDGEETIVADRLRAALSS